MVSKVFWRKLRTTKGIKGFLTGLILVIIFIVETRGIMAATYLWDQDTWSGGVDESNFPKHTTDKTGWTKYFSNDINIEVNEGSLILKYSSGSTTQNAKSEFDRGTFSQTSSSVSDKIELSAGIAVPEVGSDNFGCILKNDGGVYCWGNNNNGGQLGLGSAVASSPVPARVVGAGGTGYLSNIINLSVGASGACAVKLDGTVWCWGKGRFGKLGNNNTVDSFYPVQVVGAGGTGFLTDVVEVNSGYYHVCAVKSNGTAWCWGGNTSNGVLGNFSTNDSSYPVQVKNANGIGYMTDVLKISAGRQSTCVIKSNNDLWCWGSNTYGELGRGNTVGSSAPAQVLGLGGSGLLTDVNNIDASYQGYMCANKNSGELLCWGRNKYGQLGVGNTADSYTPVQVKGVGG